MKHLKFPLIAILLLSFIAGCQKELSFEQPALNLAEGSLKSGIGGDCLPMTVKGTYKAGITLGDTNYVDIEVTVTKTGSYNISSNVDNGYSFKASGNFTAPGIIPVRLKATGKPTAAGIDDFNITFDSTTCFFNVTVVAGPPPPSGPAVFTLSGTPNACGSFVPAGNYVINTALNASNTVTVGVNVTTAGTYTVSTNTVNGMTFSGSGSFATTGPQSVVLNGSGTPVAATASNFTVTAGTSSCTFSITVTNTAPPPGNNDHFPLTANSWWSYEDVLFPGDSIKTQNTTTKTFNGNLYRGFISSDDAGPYDTAYYRRSGNDYLEYTLVDNYTFFTFDAEQSGDILFLKENITTGTTWMSSEWTGAANGISTKLRYSFNCTDGNASATINGRSYTNIYKVKFKPQISVMGSPWTDTGEEIEAWYARGVGFIYLKITSGGTIETQIRNYQVF